MYNMGLVLGKDEYWLHRPPTSHILQCMLEVLNGIEFDHLVYGKLSLPEPLNHLRDVVLWHCITLNSADDLLPRVHQFSHWHIPCVLRLGEAVLEYPSVTSNKVERETVLPSYRALYVRLLHQLLLVHRRQGRQKNLKC
jgi:hypothetical protein